MISQSSWKMLSIRKKFTFLADGEQQARPNLYSLARQSPFLHTNSFVSSREMSSARYWNSHINQIFSILIAYASYTFVDVYSKNLTQFNTMVGPIPWCSSCRRYIFMRSDIISRIVYCLYVIFTLHADLVVLDKYLHSASSVNTRRI